MTYTFAGFFAPPADGLAAAVRAEWGSYERALAADPWSDAEPAPKLVELRRELLGPATADHD